MIKLGLRGASGVHQSVARTLGNSFSLHELEPNMIGDIQWCLYPKSVCDGTSKVGLWQVGKFGSYNFGKPLQWCL